MLITGDGFVKLTDFGIARDAADHTGTGAGVVPRVTGLPRPGDRRRPPAGPASDAWGLGGTLYACVEGHPPFHEGTPIDTVAAVVNDPVPPHPHAAALGPAIAGLLVKSPSLRMTISQARTLLRGVAARASRRVRSRSRAASAGMPRGRLIFLTATRRRSS